MTDDNKPLALKWTWENLDEDMQKILTAMVVFKFKEAISIAQKVGLPTYNVQQLLYRLKENGVVYRQTHYDRPPTWHINNKFVMPDVKPDNTPDEPSIDQGHLKALSHFVTLIDPTTLTSEEIDNLILTAVDNKFRTYNGIKTYCGFPPTFDLTNTLHRLRDDDNGPLQLWTGPLFAAYFRKEDLVIRAWLPGNGTVEAEFANQKEQPAAEETERQSDAWPIPEKKSRFTKVLDLDVVEELAATCRNQAEICEKIGISVSGFNLKLKDAETRKRYDLGRARYLASKGKQSLDPAVVEQLARGGYTERVAAKQLGISAPTFINLLNTQGNAISEAWDRGLENRAAEDINSYPASVFNEKEAPSIEEKETTTIVGEVVNEDPPAEPQFQADELLHDMVMDDLEDEIKELILEDRLGVTTSFLREVDVPTDSHAGVIITDARPRVHHKFVTFKNGGQVLVGFEGNIFETTAEERKLIDQMTDLFQKYDSGSTNNTTQIDEFTRGRWSIRGLMRKFFN